MDGEQEARAAASGIGGSSSADNEVLSNVIGTSRSGTQLWATQANGVHIVSDASNDTVGGVLDAAGNRIATSGADGVSVSATSTGNSILANSVLSNDVTNNDPDDPDTGANNLQNFPAITSRPAGATPPASRSSPARPRATPPRTSPSSAS